MKEIYWRNTMRELPQESYQCLVWVENDYKLLYWNSDYHCWDDEAGDDYYCGSKEVDKWIPIDEIEDLPIY